MPNDWKPGTVSDLPAEIAALAAQWPKGAFEAEGQAFAQYWRGRGGRRADWNAQWAARVQARHAEVMRADKAGVRFSEPAAGAAGQAVAPVLAQKREDRHGAEVRALLEESIDPAEYAAWLAAAAFVFEDCGLVVVAPGRFAASEIEKRFRRGIEAALAMMGRGVDWMRFVAESPAGAARAGGKAARRG